MPRQLYKFYEVEHSQHDDVLDCFAVGYSTLLMIVADDVARRRRDGGHPPMTCMYVCGWVGVWVYGGMGVCVCVFVCVCVCVIELA